MDESWLARWNERYSLEGYAFGDQPNQYFKAQIEKLKPDALLLPAEGEGRNAVFAAGLGWTVSAFDISEEGRKKAFRLAESMGVTIDYQVGELQSLHYTPGEFDAMALIYAHFPTDIKSKYHKALDQYVRKNGIVIIEAFSKRHLDYIARNEKVGGPRELGMLFSLEEVQADFENYDILELAEVEVELKEGQFHDGLGSVIRFVGRKK